MIVAIFLLIVFFYLDLSNLLISIKLLKKYLKLEWEGEVKVKYAWKTNVLTMIMTFVVIDILGIIIFLNNNGNELFKTSGNMGLFMGIIWRFLIWRTLKYWSRDKDIVYILLKS